MNEPTTTTKDRYIDRLAAEVTKNHNLRALILRLADVDFGASDPPCPGRRLYALAERKSLTFIEMPLLTDLGRDVAAAVRPVKWTASIRTGALTTVVVSRPDGTTFAMVDKFDEAQRVVGLLNADDIAAAKRYKVKS